MSEKGRIAGGSVRFADPRRARRVLLFMALAVFLLSGPISWGLSRLTELVGRSRFMSYDLVLRAQDLLVRSGQLTRPRPRQVVVVGIDERSLQKYGRWPWSRFVMAELLQGLDRLGVCTQAVDVLLSEPQQGPLQELHQGLQELPRERREQAYGELHEAVEQLMAGAPERPLPGADAPREEWLFRPDGEDRYLARTLGELGSVVLGTALEWEGSGTAQTDWLHPRQEDVVPPAVVEVLAAHRPELSLEELDQRWRSRTLFPLFADDAGGLPAVPVGGYGGFSLAELEARMNAVQMARLRMVEVPSPSGARVQGLYLPRGIFLLEAAGAGFMNDEPTFDGVARAMPLVRSFYSYGLPSLSLAALSHSLGAEAELWLDETGVPEAVRFDREGETVRMPVNEYTQVWVNFYPTSVPGADLTTAEYRPWELARPALEHVSAGDVLDAGRGLLQEQSVEELRRRLEGRLAFVGVTALGLTDIRATPLGERRPGTEVHATVTANLLNGDTLSFGVMEDLVTHVLRFLLLMVFAWAMPRQSPLHSLATLLGLTLVAYLVCVAAVVRGSILIPWDLAYPLGVLFAIGLAYLNLHENRDKRWIEDMFKRYVAPEYVEELKRNKGALALGGKELEISAFFSDLERFSSLSERFHADRLFTFLGEYLGEMAEVLDAYGGTLDKFEGDAVVAFFGAPIPAKDHALRACLAALDMQARLRELNERWRQDEARYPELHELAAEQGRWWQIRARIGINTGLSAVGHLGTLERGNYTMMGDHVNLASRLEGACKHYRMEICISEDTYEQVQDHVVAREADLIRVVGKSVPTRVYELLGQRGELSEEDLKRYERYRLALERYKARAFDKALEGFSSLLRETTHDKLVEIYVERCVKYQNRPPSPDWDGVTAMTSK